jgi:hypothetical protein
VHISLSHFASYLHSGAPANLSWIVPKFIFISVAAAAKAANAATAAVAVLFFGLTLSQHINILLCIIDIGLLYVHTRAPLAPRVSNAQTVLLFAAKKQKFIVLT